MIKDADNIRKKAEYDKAGLKIDNQMAQARGNSAKKIDEKLGTNLSGIKLPEWAKKLEAYMAKALDENKNKKSTQPRLAKNQQNKLYRANKDR